MLPAADGVQKGLFLPFPRRANRVHARLAVLYCDVFACCGLSLPFLPTQEQTRGTLNIEP